MRLAGPILGVMAVGAALSLLLGGELEAIRDVDRALGTLREFGAWAGVAAVGLLSADLVLPVPASAVIAALGTTYGLVGGGLVGSAGLVAAGSLGYGLVRVLGRRAAVALAGESRLERLQAFFDRSGAWAIVLTRGLPIVPEVVACLAGLARMRPARFFLALGLGSLPMGFAYAAIGAGWRDHPSAAIAGAYLLPLLLLPWTLKLMRERPSGPSERPRRTW
jgi:uncharacterized membrane protein YdjX (TVP38/TMEM64 family)